MLLEALPADTLKGQRDRVILATLLYYGLRCEELCALKVGDLQPREGVPHLRVEGKRDKVRYLPRPVLAQRLVTASLEAAGPGGELHGPLFRPVKKNCTKTLAKPLYRASGYHYIVKRYASEFGLTDVIPGLCVHSLRATAATNVWPTRPTSRRCRNGSGTRIVPRRGCLINGSAGRRTARRSTFGIQ